MVAVSMNHFTVLTDDLSATVTFYKDLLGLTEGYRPPLGMSGAWLYAGEQAVLHVIAGRKLPEVRGGVIDHMAFTATGLEQTLQQLAERDLEFTLKQQPETGVWQLFFFDPNGARVELNFARQERE